MESLVLIGRHMLVCLPIQLAKMMRLRYASTRAKPLLHWACLPYSLISTSAPQSTPAPRPVRRPTARQSDKFSWHSPPPIKGIRRRGHGALGSVFLMQLQIQWIPQVMPSHFICIFFSMIVGVLEGGGFQRGHTANPTASSGSSAARCPGSVRGARLSKIYSVDWHTHLHTLLAGTYCGSVAPLSLSHWPAVPTQLRQSNRRRQWPGGILHLPLHVRSTVGSGRTNRGTWQHYIRGTSRSPMVVDVKPHYSCHLLPP
jgi:hypothetical protein